jgi:hypothetical protein
MVRVPKTADGWLDAHQPAAHLGLTVTARTS